MPNFRVSELDSVVGTSPQRTLEREDLLGRLESHQARYGVEQVARLDADALRVREVTRVLEGDAQLERVPLCSWLGEQLRDVGDADIEPCFLEVRAAARGVDGDGVHTGERLGHRPCHAFPLLSPSGVKVQGVPDDLTYEALLQRIFESDQVITW